MTKIILHRRQHAAVFAFGAKCAVQIDIAAADFDSTVDGYPLLINPDTSTTLRDLILDADGTCPALNGGGDLRVVTDPNDEGTRLAIDIVTLITDNTPANGEMEIYLEAGTVNSSTGRTIYLLWGIPAATQPVRTAAFGADEVWDQTVTDFDWRVVSHLNDKTTSTTSDSAPGDITMNKTGSGTPAEVDGAWASSKAQDFNFTTDYWIDIVDNALLDCGSTLALMAWIKYPSGHTSGFQQYFARKTDFTQTNGWQLTDSSTNGVQIIGSGSSFPVVFVSGTNLYDTNWHCIMFNLNGTNGSGLLDGVFDDAGTIQSVVDNNLAITLGQDPDHNGSAFEGQMDEFRLNNGNISTDAFESIYKGLNAPGSHVSITVL